MIHLKSLLVHTVLRVSDPTSHIRNACYFDVLVGIVSGIFRLLSSMQYFPYSQDFSLLLFSSSNQVTINGLLFTHFYQHKTVLMPTYIRNLMNLSKLSFLTAS